VSTHHGDTVVLSGIALLVHFCSFCRLHFHSDVDNSRVYLIVRVTIASFRLTECTLPIG